MKMLPRIPEAAPESPVAIPCYNQRMAETLLNLLLFVGILGLSAVATQLFASRMYNRCHHCGSLNAKRRERCRVCSEPLP